jgi:hypothetical protein
MNDLFSFLSITLTPIGLAILGLLYKSKCKNLMLCYGCLKLERNVDDETKVDLGMLQSPTASQL